MTEKFRLEKIAEYMNDEMGEYLSFLCGLSRYTYCMPDDFRKAVERQIEREKQTVRDCFKVVKEKQTYTRETLRVIYEDEFEYEEDAEEIEVD